MTKKLKSMLLISAAVIYASAMPAFAKQPYEGVVKKVNEAEGKVTLTHGPIKKFDMDGNMTMIYRVADPAMLKELKVGEKITFDTDKVNGKFTLTKIEKAK